MTGRGAVSFELVAGARGVGAVVWNDVGVVAVLLPSASKEEVQREVRRRFAGAARGRAPGRIRPLVGALERLGETGPRGLEGVPTDLTSATPFARRVYEIVKQLEPGRTLTYGEVARRAGSPGAARAVGQAMARNPVPLLVPCHRVIGADGGMVGFSASGGTELKRSLLARERTSSASPASLRRPHLFEENVRLEGRRHVANQDQRMGRAMDAVGSFELSQEHPGRPFAALAVAVVYQQLSGKAAGTISSRVAAAVGEGSFPTPRQLLEAPMDTLRGAGLSGSKARTVREMADRVVDGRLDLVRLCGAPDEEVEGAVRMVKGVGVWTANMFLIFHLGRPDVLPATDLGIRKAVQALWGLDQLPSPERVLRIGRKWSPYRTIATWYLWRSLGTVSLGCADRSGPPGG